MADVLTIDFGSSRTATDLQFLDHVVKVHNQMGGNRKSDMSRKFICRL